MFDVISWYPSRLASTSRLDDPGHSVDMSSLTLMVELVGATKRVLDVGCAKGGLAAILRQRGCTVSGIDLDGEAAEAARPHLERLVIADVETVDLAEAFEGERFDVVVLGDVLGHLRDPLSVLRKVRMVLADRGSVVASIPNIAHGSVRLAVMAGRFEYQDEGLLDRSRIRFFTRRSIEAMFDEAGMVPTDLRRATAGFFDTLVPLRQGDFAPGVVEAVETDPESRTHQFVLRAVRDDADAEVSRLRASDQSHRATNVALRAEVSALGATARSAIARAEDADRLIADLTARLKGTADERDAVRDELDRVLATRTMRWSRRARLLYAELRALA